MLVPLRADASPSAPDVVAAGASRSNIEDREAPEGTQMGTPFTLMA